MKHTGSGEFRVKGGKPRSMPMNEWVYSHLASKARDSVYVFTSGPERPFTGDALFHKFKG